MGGRQIGPGGGPRRGGARFCCAAAASAVARSPQVAFCAAIIDNLHCPAISRIFQRQITSLPCDCGDEGNALRGTRATGFASDEEVRAALRRLIRKRSREDARRPGQRGRSPTFHQSCQPHTERSGTQTALRSGTRGHRRGEYRAAHFALRQQRRRRRRKGHGGLTTTTSSRPPTRRS